MWKFANRNFKVKGITLPSTAVGYKIKKNYVRLGLYARTSNCGKMLYHEALCHVLKVTCPV